MSLPEILTVKSFDELRERFIEDIFLPHAIREVGPERADQIAQGLLAPNETAALLLDCMILYSQQNTRNENYKALQQFSQTATDSEMIDLIVGRLGIKRQVLEPADNSVFPPKSAVMESNASVLLRYSLAPYGLATTGTRTGYRFHSLTMGERPKITVEAESENVVLMRYEFQSTDGIERPRDAQARMIEANSGKVENRLLAFGGDGTASPELCAANLAYLTRDDIAQETDELSSLSADIIPYQIEIDCEEVSEPGQLIDREALSAALWNYASNQHALGGVKVLRSKIDQIAHNHNADSLVIVSPAADILAEWYQAPYCTGVTINVRPAAT
ncbi:hypothetical protein KCG43_20105 [Photobacterium sp. WH24]|uniref:hypothetical protein n=1 Tax=Photobacterium sp. WH24 TaxID=2827237 RepID=UPI001C46C1AD|nr:hypothetical protein [Photobacterium sp. WH24]MBV7264318.1 hypothetical protein [Photobacterium sp. WH24]